MREHLDRKCSLIPTSNVGTFDGVYNIFDALEHCGRIKNHSCKTGIDDIQVKLGYNWFYNCNNHAGFYCVGTFPTKKCKRKYSQFFEPFIGSRHYSFGIGFNGDYTPWCCDNQGITLMADFKYRYVFAANEHRLFDLIGAPLSRYSLVTPIGEPCNVQSSINFLTQCARITPNSTIDFWTALNYEICDFNIEFGYNLWWKNCERICLKEFLPNFMIDSTHTQIDHSHINIHSGAHPRAITNKIYAALSYSPLVGCSPAMIGIGGSYEFAQNCKMSAFDHWALWTKFAISY